MACTPTRPGAVRLTPVPLVAFHTAELSAAAVNGSTSEPRSGATGTSYV